MIRSHRDLSSGIEKIPVEVDSSVQLFEAGLCDFLYVQHSVLGCDLDTEEFLDECFVGCHCKDVSCSLETNCPCIERFGAVYDGGSKRLIDFEPHACQMRPIIECNPDCQCSKSCSNRVVQHGVTRRLQVFDTGARGLGVLTKEYITKYDFVCEYAGELLSRGSALRRSRHTAQTARHNYILAVHEFMGSSSENKKLITYIDATYFGNVGRLINHSCDPNLFMVPVRLKNDVPHVALFALRDIEAETELSYDYSGLCTDVVRHEKQAVNRKRCLCGASCCKTYLPLDDSLL